MGSTNDSLLDDSPDQAPSGPAPTAVWSGPARPCHPSPAGSVGSAQVLDLVTRRLFHPDGPGGALLPDLAARLPDRETDVSTDGRTYRIPLRTGIFWDAQHTRPVVAADVVRGLKRVCLSSHRRARRHLGETIEGLADFCGRFDAAFAACPPGAPELAQFSAQNEVSGLKVLDPQTVQLRLTRPSVDILHILSTGFTAAAPREYDYHLPDSYELYRFAPSLGPYRILRTAPNRELELAPNPRWEQASDPVRTRAHERITVRPVAATRDRIASPVPAPAPTARLLALAFNAQGAGADPGVRRAIAAAIDTERVAAAAGGVPGTVRARAHAHLSVPSEPEHTVQPRPPDQEAARRLLTRVGVGAGLKIRLVAPPGAEATALTKELTSALSAAGITVLLGDAASGEWDLALFDWLPDWAGPNDRAVAGTLLRTGAVGPAGHAPPAGYLVDAHISRWVAAALTTQDPRWVEELWSQVHDTVTRLMPMIPLAVTWCTCCAPFQDAGPIARWYSAPAGEGEGS